jgi:hypothetical protein
MQSTHGCSVCGWAGSSRHGNSLMPGLTPPQLEELRRSGKRIYCVWFKRPVDSSEGRTCSSFRADR